jgi:glutathione S-transferase
MQLFFSPNSPYVRKCLVASHELGLEGRIKLLASNANPIKRDAEIIAKNPLGKVPTFITEDGQTLYDSRVICEYLDDLAKGTLHPHSGKARWEALTLQSLGDGMMDACLLARYEDIARPEAMRWPEWRAGQLDKVETALTYLEANIAVVTDRVDIGSLTIGCALWYLDLRFDDLDWRTRHPKVKAWYVKFSQRPSMQMAWSL